MLPTVQPPLHSLQLPREIGEYRPADLPNGCMVEAVVFADWFMTKEFDGPKSWAQAVFIKARLQGRKLDHAVALFQFEGRLFLWDVEWGVMPLSINERGRERPESLAELAERTYNDWLRRAERLAASGRTPVPKARLPLPPGKSTFVWAAERLNPTRPILQGVAQLPAGERPFMVFVVQERMYVYDPEVGTVAAAWKDQPKETLTRILRKMFGPLKDMRITEAREPGALAGARPGG
jgi:hypothetical protein